MIFKKTFKQIEFWVYAKPYLLVYAQKRSKKRLGSRNLAKFLRPER